MNKAFEKILERFDEKKQYYQKFYDTEGKTEQDKNINKSTQLAFDEAKEIVQEVAGEYNQTIDLKQRIAGMYAHHMVNYGIDVTSKWETAVQQAYALQKAYIRGKQEERDRLYEHIKEHNNSWIPCSERLPEEPFGCLVTVIDCEPVTQNEFENILPYFVGYDGHSWNDADGNEIPFEVIAWQPLPKPFTEIKQ